VDALIAPYVLAADSGSSAVRASARRLLIQELIHNVAQQHCGVSCFRLGERHARATT